MSSRLLQLLVLQLALVYYASLSAVARAPPRPPSAQPQLLQWRSGYAQSRGAVALLVPWLAKLREGQKLLGPCAGQEYSKGQVWTRPLGHGPWTRPNINLKLYIVHELEYMSHKAQLGSGARARPHQTRPG